MLRFNPTRSVVNDSIWQYEYIVKFVFVAVTKKIYRI